MHTYSTIMIIQPTATWQDILGKAVKPILYANPTSTFESIRRSQPLLNIFKTSNNADHSFSTYICFADCRSGSSYLSKGRSSRKGDHHQKRIFCIMPTSTSMPHTQLQYYWNQKPLSCSTLGNVHSLSCLSCCAKWLVVQYAWRDNPTAKGWSTCRTMQWYHC